MAESDFLSYNSSYNSFSKGPKSIYYSLGDEMLPGVILNIPQDDVDDEWGRTERIALERSFDFIGKIYKTLFDPYNTIPEISIVPGEAGSELNIAKNMIKLIGRPGIDEGVFDLSVPKLTLGNITIDGSSNTFTIGTSLSISENTLSFLSLFNIEINTNEGILNYKDVTINLNDDGSTKYIKFNVDGKVYYFTKNGLEIGPGLNISIDGSNLLDSSGNLITKNIYPLTGNTYNIGSQTLYYDNLYANKINCFYLCSSNIYPMLYDTLNIGKLDYSTNLHMNLYSYELKLDSNMEVIKASKSSMLLEMGEKNNPYAIKIYGNNIKFFGNTSLDPNPIFHIFTCGYIIETIASIIPKVYDITLGTSVDKFNYLYTRNIDTESAYVRGPLNTQNILPLNNNYDIGSEDALYSRLYARYLYNVYTLANDSDVRICGASISFRTPTNIILDIEDSYIRARQELITANLRPYDTLNTLGTICGGYYAIYLRDHATGIIKMLRINNNTLEIY